MTRAVLRNGVIVPLDPLPSEWKEGEELIVESARGENLSPEELDRWAREMDELCADSDPKTNSECKPLLMSIDAKRRTVPGRNSRVHGQRMIRLSRNGNKPWKSIAGRWTKTRRISERES